MLSVELTVCCPCGKKPIPVDVELVLDDDGAVDGVWASLLLFRPTRCE